MCLRNFPHIILVLQMVGLPFQSEIVATLTIRYRVTQQSLESCRFDHMNLLTFNLSSPRSVPL